MLKNERTYQKLQLISLLLLPWGLFFSEALASILVIVFAIPLLLYGKSVQMEKMLSSCWPYFLIYGLLLLSGFWSADSIQWISLLRVNLPYIVLPFAFFLWPDHLRDHRRSFQRQFVWAGLILSLYIIGYMVLNGESISAIVREGGSFPVPVQHVRTSLFLAIAGLFSWDELAQATRNSRGYMIRCTTLIVLILGLHILAVRTGLILFYLGTILTFILNKNLKGKKMITWFILLTIILVLTIFFIPTLHDKWNYFLEDIRNYESTSWWFYSDAVRWKSNELGWQITRNSPWWGVGLGDVMGEMHMQFYNQENVRIWEYPHNLWITFLAGSGLIGFMLLNLALSQIGLHVWKCASIVFLIIFIVYIFSCLVENTLLTSLGSISFLVITLLANDNSSENFSGEIFPKDQEQN